MKGTWPGANEQLIVEEMIRDLHSEHWEACYTFVKWCVYTRAKNIPNELWDDIVQEIMVKITKYLPHFRFQCTLKTWLNAIVNNHIIDEYRKRRSEGSHLSLSVDTSDEADNEIQEPNANGIISTEDAFEMQEEIRIGMEALREYANSHANPIRNKQIIRMLCFEGKTYAEAAEAAGCNAPVARYVIHEAQRYAREKWNCYW